jgi:hypothetical protein
MSDNDAKGLIAQAIYDDGRSFLASGGEFCGLSKDAGRGELNTGEGGASREIVWFDGMRDSLILKDSLKATEPKAEIRGFAAVKFREK